MAKDPAFLFYSNDFLTGTLTLTFEERGKYITLLCLMHQQGRLKEETVRFVIGDYSSDLRNKFHVDVEGKWFNKRLEEETERRNKYTESRRNNAKKKALNTEHMLPHMEIENEIENKKEIVNKIQLPFTDFFALNWLSWKQYKLAQHKFKYKSAQTEKASLAQLVKLSGNSESVAVSIINQSIANGWKGFFELKTNHNEAVKRNADTAKPESRLTSI